MKKYEFIEVKTPFYGLLEEHRKVITEYAEKGYQFVAAVQTGIGVYDLIFEIAAE